MKSIEDSFQIFIDERTSTLSTYFSTHDEHYINASQKSTIYFNLLMAKLPTHMQSILFKYEESMNLCNSLSQDFMYLQGFKDGNRLVKCILLE